MEFHKEIYTTTITIHPRVIQLQRVLTLDDYLQIQALLEYFQKRQAFVSENQHAQLRLERALNNIRLLKLEHKRQHAAQIQRFLQQHHEQCHQYDRAKLMCALEQHRDQLAFRQFLEQQQENENENTTQLPEVKQLNELVTSSESSIQIDNQMEEEPLAVQPGIDTQDKEEEEEVEENKTDDEDEEEEYDDEYKKYQSKQLEDLLKLLFEKHQHQEELNQKQQSSLPPQFEKKEDEDVYEPLYRQTGPVSTFDDPPIFQRQTVPISTFDDPPIFQRQTAPISTFDNNNNINNSKENDNEKNDQQTLTDILPILQQNEENQEQNKGIETSSDLKHGSDINQPQPILLSEGIKENNNNKPLLPDHVSSLEDVLNQLVHSSTPVPPEEEKEKEMKLNETNQSSSPPPQQQHKEEQDPEVTEKLNKLNEIENRIEKLFNEHHEKAIQIPLQYQVNDQGKLFLDGNTPDNRFFLGYEDDIVRCMLQLDNILSDGDINIRNQRRKIIQRAESILEQLDHHKQQEWEKETRKQNTTSIATNGKKHRHRKRKHHVPITA